jgi:hypothetical protein
MNPAPALSSWPIERDSPVLDRIECLARADSIQRDDRWDVERIAECLAHPDRTQVTQDEIVRIVVVIRIADGACSIGYNRCGREDSAVNSGSVKEWLQGRSTVAKGERAVHLALLEITGTDEGTDSTGIVFDYNHGSLRNIRAVQGIEVFAHQLLGPSLEIQIESAVKDPALRHL